MSSRSGSQAGRCGEWGGLVGYQSWNVSRKNSAVTKDRGQFLRFSISPPLFPRVLLLGPSSTSLSSAIPTSVLHFQFSVCFKHDVSLESRLPKSFTQTSSQKDRALLLWALSKQVEMMCLSNKASCWRKLPPGG